MALNRVFRPYAVTVRAGRSKDFPLVATALAAFVLVYGQSPLFTQNQNAYLLAPAASAGYGHLAYDWLANQAFPFHLFNAIAALTFRSGQEWLFHVYHAVLAAVYFASLVSLIALLCPREQRQAALRFAAIAVVLIHVPVGELAGRLAGATIREPLAFLTNGLADQHLFGREFQPSAFGVLSLAAIALFQAQRSSLAMLALAAAAYMHPSYVVMNGIIVVGWAVHVALQGEWRKSIGISAIWVMICAPIVFDLVRLTGGADEEVVRAGKVVLARRIPMHTDPSVWFGAGSVVKLALILAAGLVSREQAIGRILLVGFAVCAASTLWMAWQFVPAVALTFPWRVSAVLVPAANAVLLARIWPWLGRVQPGRGAAAAFAALVLAGSGLAGAYLQIARWEDRRQADWMGIVAHARATSDPASIYLLPPSEGPHRRFWELQGFRLASGVPSYVDATSHPVSPGALLVWQERLDFAIALYRRDIIDCGAVADLRRRAITHLVVASGTSVDCSSARRVHADPAYEVYAMR